MLRGKQLEGMRGLIDSLQGKEEITNSAEREKMKRFLHFALDHGLTELQRKVIHLIYVEGLSQKQAGELLNIKQPAVSNIKRRAISKLRDLSKYMTV